jgi:hypothetical protein
MSKRAEHCITRGGWWQPQLTSSGAALKERTHGHIGTESEATKQKRTEIREHTGSWGHEEGNHADKANGWGETGGTTAAYMVALATDRDKHTDTKQHTLEDIRYWMEHLGEQTDWTTHGALQ